MWYSHSVGCFCHTKLYFQYLSELVPLGLDTFELLCVFHWILLVIYLLPVERPLGCALILISSRSRPRDKDVRAVYLEGWKVIPVSTGREVGMWDSQGKETNKRSITDRLLQWAREAQSHRGFLGDSAKRTAGSSQQSQEGLEDLSIKSGCHWLCAVGGGALWICFKPPLPSSPHPYCVLAVESPLTDLHRNGECPGNQGGPPTVCCRLSL